MPMYNGNYAAPVWVNGVPPAIGPTELRAMSGTIENSQILSGSGAPTTATAGAVGQLYIDTSASPPAIWQMTAQDGEAYIWVTERDIEKNLADTYDSASTYAEGDFCIYGGILYRANTDIDTPEAWDATHWTETRIADAAAAHFARRDNPHEVTAAQAGLGNVENVLQYSPANPSLRRGTVAFEGTWSGATSPYTKTITVTGPTVTATSHVELQFTPSQMEDLMSRGVRSVHVYNNGGVLTAMAWGGVPGSMTAQCTVEELGVNKNYVRFHSPQSFTIGTYLTSKGWNGALYYSTDQMTWTEWDGTTAISSGYTNEIFMRGTGNTRITNTQGSGEVFRWVINGSSVEADGNIEALLDWETVAEGERPTANGGCFSYMFYGCTALVKAPSPLSVTVGAYAYMFARSGLVEAPDITGPLTNECCYHMFDGCTSLRKAANLSSAEFIGQEACSNMYRGCTSLTEVSDIAVSRINDWGCAEMFSGCTSLVNPPKISVTTYLGVGACESMFEGCTGLTGINALQMETLESLCYNKMYRGCTKIKISETQTAEYSTPYRIPISGTGVMPPDHGYGPDAMKDMFANTGGTFTGTPTINTTYYTSNAVVSAT